MIFQNIIILLYNKNKNENLQFLLQIFLENLNAILKPYTPKLSFLSL